MKYFDKFRVKPGQKVKLDEVDPDFTDAHVSRDDAAKEVKSDTRRLRELQERLYAERGRSLLICLQAIDAGGKDGTVRHVLGAMNPQGCKVISFKEPTRIELDHDFLWRVHQQVPGKGEVAVFNRSHYEDVIVAKVDELVPKKTLAARYDQINAFENLLIHNQTHVLKFFLHISKEEQLKRFKARLEDPTKQWKISESDYADRERWGDYMTAFEKALSKCSTEHAPWFIIPANKKWFRNLAVARIVVEYLDGLELKYPPPTVDLAKIRQEYHEAESDSETETETETKDQASGHGPP
ncbi:polyphosphate:nucleotide phosphotransferase, PPK2 family [Singulisphaera sp. GP187]|uniref:polyphosphate kinase 2 family protein n=1 Tax=Singulisphaera sp. GP187 TaxID=1882752 RepID=UPI00092616C3|nr:polyphosphate kinase 2 family protein [Singulisphaera sp. GP187]SIO24131.1 polyphosphate:nucleotide phosphotransferase, PPK2 family [Singulisphaera sp. GP187]